MAETTDVPLIIAQVLLSVLDATSTGTLVASVPVLAGVAIVAFVTAVVSVGHTVVLDNFTVRVTTLASLATSVSFLATLVVNAARDAASLGRQLVTSTSIPRLVSQALLFVVLLFAVLFPAELLSGLIRATRPVFTAVAPPLNDVTSVVVSVAETVYPLHTFYNIRLQSTLLYPPVIDVARCDAAVFRPLAVHAARASIDVSSALAALTPANDVPDFENASLALLRTVGVVRIVLECTCASAGALTEPTISALVDDGNAGRALAGATEAPFVFVSDARRFFDDGNFSFDATITRVLEAVAHTYAAGDDVIRRNWNGVARTTIDRADGVPWVDFVGGPPVVVAPARVRFTRRIEWARYLLNIIGNAGVVFTTFDGRELLGFTPLVENNLIPVVALRDLSTWAARSLRHVADDIEGECVTTSECNDECRPRQGYGRCAGDPLIGATLCTGDADCSSPDECDYTYGTCGDGSACNDVLSCTGAGRCVAGACALNHSSASGVFANYACTEDADCDVCVRPEARCTGTCTGATSQIGTCTLYIVGGVVEAAGEGNLAYERLRRYTWARLFELVFAAVYTYIGRLDELIRVYGDFNDRVCPDPANEYCAVPRNPTIGIVLDAPMYFAGHREERSTCPMAVCNLPRCVNDTDCVTQGTAGFGMTLREVAPHCDVGIGRCVYTSANCASSGGAVVPHADCTAPRAGTFGRRCYMSSCETGGVCNGSITYAPDFDCACTCPPDIVRDLALEITHAGVAVGDAAGHVFGEASATRCLVTAVSDMTAEFLDGTVDFVLQTATILSTCPVGEKLGRCGGDQTAGATFCSNSGNCSATGERCDFTYGTCIDGTACLADAECAGAAGGACVANVCNFDVNSSYTFAADGLLTLPRARACNVSADCASRCFRPSPGCRELDSNAREIMRAAQSAGGCFADALVNITLPNATAAPVNSSVEILARIAHKGFDVPLVVGPAQAYASAEFFNGLLAWAVAGTHPVVRTFAVATIGNIIKTSSASGYSLGAVLVILAGDDAASDLPGIALELEATADTNIAAAETTAEDIVSFIEEFGECVFAVPAVIINLFQNLAAAVEGDPVPNPNPFAPLGDCIDALFEIFLDVLCTSIPDVCDAAQYASCLLDEPFDPPIAIIPVQTCTDLGVPACSIKIAICHLNNLGNPFAVCGDFAACGFPQPTPEPTPAPTPAPTTPAPTAAPTATPTASRKRSVVTTTTTTSTSSSTRPMFTELLPALCEAFMVPCATDDVAAETARTADDAFGPTLEFLRDETCTRTASTAGVCEPAFGAAPSMRALTRSALDDEMPPPRACCLRDADAPATLANMRAGPCASAAMLRIEFADVHTNHTCVVRVKRGCFTYVDDATIIDALGAHECCNAATPPSGGGCAAFATPPLDGAAAWTRYTNARAALARVHDAVADVIAPSTDFILSTDAAHFRDVLNSARVHNVARALRAQSSGNLLVEVCLRMLESTLSAHSADAWPLRLVDTGEMTMLTKFSCARFLELEASQPIMLIDTYAHEMLNRSIASTARTRFVARLIAPRSPFLSLATMFAETTRDVLGEMTTIASGDVPRTLAAASAATPHMPARGLASHLVTRLDASVGTLLRGFARVNFVRMGLRTGRLSPTPLRRTARRLARRFRTTTAPFRTAALRAYPAVSAYIANPGARLTPVLPPSAPPPAAYGRRDGPRHTLSGMAARTLARTRATLAARLHPPRVRGVDIFAEDACTSTDTPFECCPTQTVCLNCSALDRLVFAALDSGELLTDFHTGDKVTYAACDELAQASAHYTQPADECAASVCASLVCLDDAECAPGVACIERISRCNASAITPTCTCADTYRTRHRLVPSIVDRLADAARVPEILNYTYVLEVARGTPDAAETPPAHAYVNETRARLTADVTSALVTLESSVPAASSALDAGTTVIETALYHLGETASNASDALLRLGARFFICDVRTGLVCTRTNASAPASCSSLDDERVAGVGLVGAAVWALLVIVPVLVVARAVPLAGTGLAFSAWTLWSGFLVPTFFMYAYGGGLGCYSTLPALLSRLAVHLVMGLLGLLVSLVLTGISAIPCVESTQVERLRDTLVDALEWLTKRLVQFTMLSAVPLCFWRDVASLVRETLACVPVPPGAISLERTPLATLTASCYDASVPPPEFITAADVAVGNSSLAGVHDVFFYWLQYYVPGINEVMLNATGGVATGFSAYYAAHTDAAHASADPVLMQGYATLHAGYVLVSFLIFLAQFALFGYGLRLVTRLGQIATTSTALAISPVLLAQRSSSSSKK